jgi:hypothetical protein
LLQAKFLRGQFFNANFFFSQRRKIFTWGKIFLREQKILSCYLEPRGVILRTSWFLNEKKEFF